MLSRFILFLKMMIVILLQSSEMKEIDTVDVVAESLGDMLEQKRIEFLSNVQESKNHLMGSLVRC